MDVIDLTARTVLAAVMLFAGIMKLRDSNWPQAAAALGVPAWIARLVAPGELVLGALLVADVANAPVSWVALGVLLAFSVVLVVALRKPIDERPRCACFGAWTQRPVSWWSLARNGAFSVVALVSALV